MSADSLYDNLRSYLRLAARVTKKVGSDINVGEKFTLKFTGSNSAYSATKVGQPRIIFKNAKIYVEGTNYAEPTGGSGWHNLPDSSLYPGESSSVSIEFKALRNLPWIIDRFASEQVAKAWIKADLDQDKFFELWNYDDVNVELTRT